jgi:hypothetical protein
MATSEKPRRDLRGGSRPDSGAIGNGQRARVKIGEVLTVDAITPGDYRVVHADRHSIVATNATGTTVTLLRNVITP